MKSLAQRPMSPNRRLHLAPRLLSTAFGLLMAAAPAIHAEGLASVAVTVAVLAVLAGLTFRPAATLAVLLSVLAIVLSDSSALSAAISGLSAATYLVVRHAVGAPAGVVTTTQPTLIAAVGFTFAAVVATSVPLQLPWLPLLAPLSVVGIYVLALRPFLGAVNWPTRRG
jgi:hypothetical protein